MLIYTNIVCILNIKKGASSRRSGWSSERKAQIDMKGFFSLFLFLCLTITLLTNNIYIFTCEVRIQSSEPRIVNLW